MIESIINSFKSATKTKTIIIYYLLGLALFIAGCFIMIFDFENSKYGFAFLPINKPTEIDLSSILAITPQLIQFVLVVPIAHIWQNRKQIQNSTVYVIVLIVVLTSAFFYDSWTDMLFMTNGRIDFINNFSSTMTALFIVIFVLSFWSEQITSIAFLFLITYMADFSEQFKIVMDDFFKVAVNLFVSTILATYVGYKRLSSEISKVQKEYERGNQKNQTEQNQSGSNRREQLERDRQMQMQGQNLQQNRGEQQYSGKKRGPKPKNKEGNPYESDGERAYARD